MSVYVEFSSFVQSIREYFYKTGAVEVFTDILMNYPNLDPHVYPVELFVFNEKREKQKKYLHTSPEYRMKEILAKEKKDIFQLTKVFRNYEGSIKHKIEFIMLEWYRVGYNLLNLIDDTHLLFINVVSTVEKSPFFTFKGKRFDMREYEIITVEQAFRDFVQVDINSIDSMNRFLKEREPNFVEKEDWEELFFHIYAFYIEKNLGKERLTFICDYPPQLTALAKIEGGYGKRFEAYIGGIELVNGYYEETDPQIIEERLQKDAHKKQAELGKPFEVDPSFLEAVKKLPTCSGASLGVERLFMVIKNMENISFL
ncbi:MAG: elongation factor P--(R)-beta-lysine ligase [Aquificae bacterium]|nr:elongation factor P--(R)-beta-lysine ligase [Aquificota bacterium]